MHSQEVLSFNFLNIPLKKFWGEWKKTKQVQLTQKVRIAYKDGIDIVARTVHEATSNFSKIEIVTA